MGAQIAAAAVMLVAPGAAWGWTCSPPFDIVPHDGAENVSVHTSIWIFAADTLYNVVVGPRADPWVVSSFRTAASEPPLPLTGGTITSVDGGYEPNGFRALAIWVSTTPGDERTRLYEAEVATRADVYARARAHHPAITTVGTATQGACDRHTGQLPITYDLGDGVVLMLSLFEIALVPSPGCSPGGGLPLDVPVKPTVTGWLAGEDPWMRAYCASR